MVRMIHITNSAANGYPVAKVIKFANLQDMNWTVSYFNERV